MQIVTTGVNLQIFQNKKLFLRIGKNLQVVLQTHWVKDFLNQTMKQRLYNLMPSISTIGKVSREKIQKLSICKKHETKKYS